MLLSDTRGFSASDRRRRSGDPDRTDVSWRKSQRHGDGRALRAVFACFSILVDLITIISVGIVTTLVYHSIAYHRFDAPLEGSARLCICVAALYVGQKLMQGWYGFHSLLAVGSQFNQLMDRWSLAFIGGIGFAFATKTSDEISRGATILYFFTGGIALAASQSLITKAALKIASTSNMFLRRVFLVGYEEDFVSFFERFCPWKFGVNIVCASVLRGAATREVDLRLAVAAARLLRPDDVFILVPWRDTDAIDACAEAFARVPAAIHIGPERVLDRFSEARISKIGPISSVRIVRRPLNLIEVGTKRVFDLVVATLALLALFPLLLIVAITIKIDSKGPVFFLQRRYGFNQEPFRVIKFRSLTVTEDHSDVKQVSRGDDRVTRVGRVIRRINIDELPQLLNVILGQMSLVGPRPHALAHEQLFGAKIAEVARRHNVRPGITGWAQVHGFRGEITSEEKLQGRIEHDLFYIDNWSPWLDLRILALTLFSSRAYTNAY